jgi:diguanylate cyclase (GGDEF)-like protein
MARRYPSLVAYSHDDKVTLTVPKMWRTDIFNRLYILAIVVVIAATGSFGIVALAQTQRSSALLQHSFQQTKDATEMGSALNRQYTALRQQVAGYVLNREHAGRRARTPQAETAMSAAFDQATRMFDAAFLRFERDGWARSEALAKTIAWNQTGLVSESRAIVAAGARGDQARAMRIEVQRLRPRAAEIREALDVISAASFRASLLQAAEDRQFSRDLQRLIGGVTLLGIALMSGFAVLLARYKRNADDSAAATLAALEHAVLTDNLTKLGNNRSFYHDFEREIARAKRHDLPLVLALIDVDDFKAVNDKGGHAHGDAVLAAVGARVLTMRREDRGYRIGGDEFALILADTDREGAAIALDRLQADIRDSGVGATVSIGYVNLIGEQLHMESYQLADSALYEAKRCGRNQTVCFEDINGSAGMFSPRKADAVRTMIARGLVRIAFQPIWDLRSTQPLGFEALARPLPELGLSGPQDAFDVAQRIRKVPALDMLCTRKALEAARTLPAGSVVFLNYSPASLAHVDFDPTAFVVAVRAAGFLPEQIVVELTERRIDEPAIVVRRTAALQALGIRIALDDTGSGNAGLEIMSRIRFDFVKVARSLVINAMQSREARGVLAGIIAIAHENESYLIAEGIETGEVLDFVRNAHNSKGHGFAGVRGIQGYLLGRPEIGSIDPTSQAQHHDFLASLRRDEPRVPEPVAVMSGGEPGPGRGIALVTHGSVPERDDARLRA